MQYPVVYIANATTSQSLLTSFRGKLGHSTPLINNLEIRTIFKDKAGEEGVGITDLINQIVQVLKKDLERLTISARDAELMEPVEP